MVISNQRAVFRRIAIISAVAGLGRSLQADTITWQSGTADWFSASNWFDVTKQTNAVPTASDNATINAGEADVNSGNAAANFLTVGGSGTLTVNSGSLSVYSLDISKAGSFSFAGGTITINGGTFSPFPEAVTVPQYDIFMNSFAVSGTAGSSITPVLSLTGFVTTNLAVSNSNPDYDTLFVGAAGGNGIANVSNFATLGVKQMQSVANFDSLFVGAGVGTVNTAIVPGQGTLNVSSNGYAVGFNVKIGYLGGAGTATVTGNSAMLTGANLYVGSGSFTSGGVSQSVGTGILTINSGGMGTFSSNVEIGYLSGVGTVNVGAGGTLGSNAIINVGAATGIGSLNLTAGGKVTTISYLDIGANAGTGTVSADGSGSGLTLNGLLVGYGASSATSRGMGTLNLTNGAGLGSGSSRVGYNGGVGNVFINHSSASFYSGGSLSIGEGTFASGNTVVPGTGTFTVSNGASVSASGSTIDVGLNKGVGTLAVSGSQMSSAGTVIGSGGGAGTVVFSGAGTSWTNSGSFLIGSGDASNGGTKGTGTLTLSNGATLNTGPMTVYPTGTLTVSSGATLTAAGLTLFSNGSGSPLPIAGGTVKLSSSLSIPGDTTVGDGTSTTLFQWTNVAATTSNGGSLRITANASLFASGSTNFPIIVLPGGTLEPSFGTGTLSALASVTLQSNATAASTFRSQLGSTATAGTTFDQLVMKSGTFTTGGAFLQIVPLSNAVLNQKYPVVLASGGSIDASSPFANLNGGTDYNDGSLAYHVDYSAGEIDVTLTSVPEAAMAFYAFGLAILGRLRRFKIRRCLFDSL